MVTVTGQSTFDDYLRAQRYHGRSRALLIAAVLGVLAVLLWLTSRDVLFGVFVALYIVVLRPIYIRVRLKRHWKLTPSAHGGQETYRLDEAGFHSEDDAGNAVVTHWDKFLKFRESKDSFLLYMSPRMYLFLPKKFMSCEDQESTRRLLREKIEQAESTVPTQAAPSASSEVR